MLGNSLINIVQVISLQVYALLACHARPWRGVSWRAAASWRGAAFVAGVRVDDSGVLPDK
jgi:hypothetical protein